MKRLAELKEKAKEGQKQIVSVANAVDKHVLQAVKMGLEEDLCDFLLIGNEANIKKLAKEVALTFHQWGDRVIIQHAETKADIARAAVLAVHENKATILMKGYIPTKDILQAVLDKDYGLRSGKILSHVALFEVPNQNKLVFLTDAAMNINPDIKQKVAIINNAVNVAHSIGLELPRVAAVTPVEMVNPDIPSTVDAALLTQMQRRGQIQGCLVDGPLAFDNAVSVKAAKQKQISSAVAGQADILLASSIEAGNVLYKSFVYYAKAKVAAIICGAKAPIILTSRADSAESKLYSLSLAIMTTKNGG